MKKMLFASVLGLFSFNLLAAPHFASGTTRSGVEWEARFNLPDCAHEGQKKGAWCLNSDKTAAAEKSGIEAKLEEWMLREDVKALYLAYFSFSNFNILNKLCEVSKAGKKVVVYLDSGYSDASWLLEKNQTCGKKFKIHFRGVGPFGTPGAHLQHMKVFLASPTEELPLITDLNGTQAQVVRNGKVRFTSSSANMSGYGTNIHFENWLFFTDKGSNYLAQKNACIFKAFAGENTRESFTSIFKSCERSISAKKPWDVRMMVAPTTIRGQHPFVNGMEYLLKRKAKRSVKVAIHRLTTNLVTRLLTDRLKRNVPVSMVMDDDTYLYAIGAGGFDVGDSDATSMQKVAEAGGDVAFIQTNEQAKPNKGHLHHNKFIVVDNKYLFQGAGNFTGKALNMGWENGKGYVPAFGNYEQFYVIRDRGIVNAYSAAFDELRRRASTPAEHPVQP